MVICCFIMSFMRSILRVFIGIVVLYVLFGFFLFVGQKSFLYYPDNQDFDSCYGFEDYEKVVFNGTRFYFKEGVEEKIIVYYHGNAGSACDRSYFKSIFEKSNASLIFVEYAGYSNDDVKPSRERIIRDVENVQMFVVEKDYSNVVIYGQSIGSGAASYHAYLGGVDDLILVTPFANLDDVAQSKYIVYPAFFLLREKYDNVKWLENYEGSLLIVHGDKDLVIPHKFSQKLFDEVYVKDKEYVLIEGIGHNDIWNSYLFQDTISNYINGLED